MNIYKRGNLVFPYEKKLAYAALDRYSRDNVEAYVLTYDISSKGTYISNRVVVYDYISDEFYCLSAKRFIERKYINVRKVESYKDIALLYEAGMHRPIVYVFGLDDYEKKYPDNGYEELEKNIQTSDIKDKLRYYLFYKKYPCIKLFVDEGLTDFIYRIDRRFFDCLDNVNGKTVEEVVGLPKEVLQLVLEHTNIGKQNQLDILKELSKYLTLDELKHYILNYANDIYMHNLMNLLQTKEYEYYRLIEYVEDENRKNNIDINTLLINLNEIYHDSKVLGIPVDYYPKEIIKKHNCLAKHIECFNSAERKKRFNDNYGEKILSNLKFSYQNKEYQARLIMDKDYHNELAKYYPNHLDINVCNDKVFEFIEKKSKRLIGFVRISRNKRPMVDLINTYNLTKKESIFIKEYRTYIEKLCLAN